MTRQTLRVALYSPGMVGLGHMRRNLLLARSFAASLPDAAFLMLTEAREAGVFTWPDSVDCISLPAIRKDAEGNCSARRLAVDLPALVRLRTAVLESALTHFAPDVLIVDHLPRGALGELGSTLPRLRKQFGTRMILGLRDILEEPATVRAEWDGAGHESTIAQCYDAVWIYGDRAVFDPLSEYAFSAATTAKVAFTGYLNPIAWHSEAEPEGADDLATELLRNERVILCQMGGGQDGLHLADAFVKSELPRDAVGVLVTGPFMPRLEREKLARQARARRDRMHVLSLIAEPTRLLRHAERVITMGGYNSVCEAIALGKRALVVPRTRPRREQLIRAKRLADLGFLTMLHPDALTPAALSAWMSAPHSEQPTPECTIDTSGLERATVLLNELLSDQRVRAHA